MCDLWWTVALEQVFCEFFGFPLPVLIPPTVDHDHYPRLVFGRFSVRFSAGTLTYSRFFPWVFSGPPNHGVVRPFPSRYFTVRHLLVTPLSDAMYFR